MTLVIEDAVSESVRGHLPCAGSSGLCIRIHLAMEGLCPQYSPGARSMACSFSLPLLACKASNLPPTPLPDRAS